MKKALALFLALLMMFALVACGQEPAPVEPDPNEGQDVDTGDVANDPQVTLVYAEVNPIEGTIVGGTAQAFKEAVEELSGGSIQIDLQAGGVLGSENDVLDSILAGSTQIDISRISAFALSSYGCSKATLLSLPFTFVSRDHFWAFAASDLAQEFLNEPQEIGLPVRGIFYGEEGFRHFFFDESLGIKSIEDLQGLKIRVSNDPVMVGMVEGLGASATVVAFNELYSALQTGVVDGAEQPITNYRSNAFPEVANTLVLDGHTLGAIEIVITDNAWNKLTPAQQDVIMQAANVAMEYDKSHAEAAEPEARELLESEGCDIVDVTDKGPWQEACSAIIGDYTKGELGDLYQQILNLAK